MKDLVTGLAIAPLTHFPDGLREAVLRGPKTSSQAANSAAPTGTALLFFAEMVRKLSAKCKRRGEKERLVVVSPEALIVYDEEGFIKRRAKITEIVAIYYTAEQSGYYTHVASTNARNKQAAVSTPRSGRSEKSGNNLPQDGGVYASVAVVLSNGYDMAFDIISSGSHTSQPTEIIGHLIRVINVLQRRNPKLAHRELTIGIVPPHSTTPFESLFTLKKPTRGGQPLLPPTLELVSEESEKQKSMDAKMQVDEAISDLLNELDKYKKENWAQRNTKYTALLKKFASSRAELERYEREENALTTEVDELTASNERRATKLNSDMTVARKQYLDSIERLSGLRNEHETNLSMIRDGCVGAEERTDDLIEQQLHSQHSYVERMRDLDILMHDLQNEKDEVEHELSLRSAMPTMLDLKKEIAALQEATGQVEESIDASHAADAMKHDLKTLSEAMKGENEELELDVLALRDVCKENEVTTQQLAFQISTLDAKRRRLALDCQKREATMKKLVAELEDANALAEQKQSLLEVQELMRETIEVEQTVCDDLQREQMMHDSITASVAHVTLANEYRSLSDERSISQELQRLRDRRIELISRNTTPGTGQTPLTSSRRHHAGTPSSRNHTPRDVVFATPPPTASTAAAGSNSRHRFKDPSLLPTASPL